MANRRPQPGGNGGRRMDFNRDGRKNFGRSGVSPWQGGGPGAGLPNLLPLAGGSTEALALASNIINLLQPRQNPVPSLLDMPIRRDFGPQMGRFDRGFVPNRMGNQGNFRRTGNYNRAGERINTNRKPFKPNDGPKQQPKSSPKKEADSKAKPKESENQDEKKEETTTEVKEEDSKKDAQKTRYDDINPQLLKCHICNKSMWDGRSFENHLSGRAHAIMMQKTAQSYALTADTMRQEFKIREMKRNRRSGQQPARDFYCAMCDMYASDGAMHRTTVGHRKLKKYLHPSCTSCHKEMPTRIELDEHRLTAEHLRNMQDKQEPISKPKPEVMVISTLSMEQSYLREDIQRKRRTDNQKDKQEEKQEGDAPKEGEEEATIKTEAGTEDASKKSDKKVLTDTESTILDYKEGEDLSHVTNEMIPIYSTKRGVGESFLGEFRCVQCRLCHKLLDSEETAQVHLRTWKHYQLFIKTLMPQLHQNQESAGQESAGNKRPMADDGDDGNFKRRRTDGAGHAGDVDQNGDANDDDMKDEPQEVQEDGNEDPDVTADDLEDWEQSVDEILNDEKANSHDPEPEPEVEPEPEPEPEPVPAPVPEPVKQPEPVKASPGTGARGSPRARARGRGRARGRY